MSIHTINIEKKTLSNNNYRNVIYTNKHQQLVLMSLNVGEYIHMEKHNGSQFFRIESGTGIAIINDKKYKLFDGVSLIVPQNTCHKIVNTSKTDKLKMYTVYSPPQHKQGEIDRRQTRSDMD